jgi:pimeloyl-ACP methyl ester carboxylesterase
MEGPAAHGLEWLSRDPAVGGVPCRSARPPRSAAEAVRPIEAARLYGRPGKDFPNDVPVLLMVGRDDPVGGPRSVHRLADDYRNRSAPT